MRRRPATSVEAPVRADDLRDALVLADGDVDEVARGELRVVAGKGREPPHDRVGQRQNRRKEVQAASSPSTGTDRGA